jgi:hypothetical protein
MWDPGSNELECQHDTVMKDYYSAAQGITERKNREEDMNSEIPVI